MKVCLIDQNGKTIRRCYENLWYQVFIPVLISAQYFNHFYQIVNSIVMSIF